MEAVKGLSMGWRRDLPDFRDLTPRSPQIEQVVEQSGPLKAASGQAPSEADLRQWCSPVEDQQSLGSCTANAAVGLLEYYERRTSKSHLDGSRLFVYKASRTLLGWTGDQGAYLRTAMKAMVLFGIPPESYWPYAIDRFDEEPPAFCYAFAQNYRATKYYRHDPAGANLGDVLASVRTYLAAGLPCMFGFSVYSSIPGLGEGTGDIPFPQPGDRAEGGHAIMAVGYDDGRKAHDETGALLIRNSWGKDWGEAGYGWLPYRYVTQGLAADFWSLLKADYVNTDLFA
jgi:C1A family cysteine protease